jgi:NADH dehydrogenase/NADH:ubiquinone oxidoreductase subunit G
MITLAIDGQPVKASEGTTVLDAARKLGIEIPTLCFLEGCRPETSCMVCLVKDLRTGKFLPACATTVWDGLAVESETDEVHAMRRTALELLLGDHLGDCEAPCRLAHPLHRRGAVRPGRRAGGNLRGGRVSVGQNPAL